MNKHLLPILVFAVSLTGGSQTQKPQQASPKFQENWTHVPKAFKGNDIVSLAKSLSSPKGEFESTAAYEERLGALVRKTGRCAFVYSCLDDYDADKESYSIKLGESSTIPLHYKDKRTDMYLERTSYKITLTSAVHFQRQFAISPIYAPKYKGKFRIILIGNIVPFGKRPSTGFDGLGTTHIVNSFYCHRSSSYAFTDMELIELRVIRNNARSYEHFVSFQLDSIWLYNELDGKIIEKAEC
jgi:hypothetical protein